MTFKKGDKSPHPAGKGNTVALKHGLSAYRRMLEGAKIDARTSLHRVLREKEQEIITALGGDPSPQEKLLIADTVKTLLYVGTVDEYLMSLNGGIIKGGKVVPVVESRTSLAAHLRRNLEALGLQRRVKERSLLERLNDPDELENPAKPANGNGQDTPERG